jgi:hypothetical protein
LKVIIALILGMLSIGIANAAVFAGYDQFCGVPVLVEKTSQIAVASRDQNGKPVIYIDPSAMNNWSHSRVFALAHECGHHRLGHATPSGMWFRNNTRWATRNQELQADCWAAIALRQIWDITDIERVINIYVKEGNSSIGGYPSGQERAENISNCAYGTYTTMTNASSLPSTAETINTKHQTPFSYKRPDWMDDSIVNLDKNQNKDISQPSRFGRYLEIVKVEIPKLFIVDGIKQRFEEKGICVAKFEFSYKDNIKHIAELDFRDDVKFRLDKPYTSSIWVEVDHWEWGKDGKSGKDINTKSKLSKINGDGSREDLISFQMIDYVKQENANMAKQVMDELVSICHGPSM